MYGNWALAPVPCTGGGMDDGGGDAAKFGGGGGIEDC